MYGHAKRMSVHVNAFVCLILNWSIVSGAWKIHSVNIIGHIHGSDGLLCVYENCLFYDIRLTLSTQVAFYFFPFLALIFLRFSNHEMVAVKRISLILMDCQVSSSL